MYYYGYGVNKDYEKAFHWTQLSAEQGYAMGQHNLAILYRIGHGVGQDYEEALRLLQLAAEQGYAGAQHSLGITYQHGYGVKKDDKEAVHWYLLAAGQGYADAQYNLANMYRYGYGVDQNLMKATFWYFSAAEKGHEKAKLRIGVIQLVNRRLAFEPRERILIDYSASFLRPERRQLSNNAVLSPGLSGWICKGTVQYQQPTTIRLWDREKQSRSGGLVALARQSRTCRWTLQSVQTRPPLHFWLDSMFIIF